MEALVKDVLTKSVDSFRGRRFLVTGSTGFKGSWLCSWLSSLGAKVTGFALPPQADAPLFDQLRLRERIEQIDGDIRNAELVTEVMRRARPEVIIHLAAQALVQRGYDEPKLTFDTNIGGGINLLEAARSAPELRALVFITSDKCYRNKEWAWGYRENDELGGPDPYSASKAAMELVFEAYNLSYFRNGSSLAAASARAGNVIGGGDRSLNRIVPDCIRALSSGHPIELRHPDSTRPWQHVLEPLSGYLVLASSLMSNTTQTAGHSWNFGPDAENVRTVREVAEKAIEIWGTGSVKITPRDDAPHESNLLMLSSSKAKTLLGWKPHWDFDEAMSRTVDWYKQIEAGADPARLTERQIADYML